MYVEDDHGGLADWYGEGLDLCCFVLRRDVGSVARSVVVVFERGER